MDLPFFKSVPAFNPRPRKFLDPSLTDFERTVLDTLDVIEQKADYAVDRGVMSHNWLVILTIFFIACNGMLLGRLLQAGARSTFGETQELRHHERMPSAEPIGPKTDSVAVAH
jgi:hypothetical protein